MNSNITVNKMAKFLCFIVFLCVSQSVLGDVERNLEELRKAALEKIELELAEMKKANDELFNHLPSVEARLAEMGQRTRDHGNSMTERIIFEISQIADSFRTKAELSDSPKDVFACIDKGEAEIHQYTDKYFNEKFLVPSLNTELKGEDQLEDQVFQWNGEYHDAMGIYDKQYKAAKKEISESSDETQISLIVAQFGKSTKEMVRLIRSVFTICGNAHRDILQLLLTHVGSLRNFLRETIDQTEEVMQKCFYKETSPLLSRMISMSGKLPEKRKY